MSYLDTLLKADPQGAGKLLEISQMHGSEYLQCAAEWIRDQLDVFAVSIGEISGPACDVVQIIGFASRALPEAMESYQLHGTPCIDVIDSQVSVCLANDAALRYPHDEGFKEYAIRSYFGLPLRDGFDRVFGILCVFDDAPRADSGGILELLEWIGPRIGNEAGNMRSRRNLVSSVDWMERVSPDEVFASAAAHLSGVLQVTTAFVVECSDDEAGTGTLRTLRHCGEPHARLQGRRFSFAGTPFERLLDEDSMIIPDRLAEAYPDDPVVLDLNIKSLIAIVIRDHDGVTIGHVGVAHSRSMDASLLHSPVFVLYKARLAAELIRLKDEHRHEELRRALAVRHKLESIGLMAGHIAHDFNNLLMAILGNANLAASLLEAESPVRRFIENIEAASTAAGDVVSQLLDYAGRKPTRAESLEVSEMVESASRLVELSRYPSARVAYQLDRGLPLVKAEPAQFQQIVVNLVLNAAEALSGKPGTITITTALVSLDARDAERLILGRDLPGGDYVCISVADDGIGMDDALLSRVFDPFYTSKPEGRGLGLSAVRGFVEGCGGGLGVVTEPGAGTRVNVFLKPSEDGVSAYEEQPVTLQAEDAASVLVVDDELVIAEMAARMLLDASFRVQVCTSGDAALAAVRQQRFDCVLLDVRMPRMDGWSTLRGIRELQPELPVVMMSGYASAAHPGDLLRRFDAVMLNKPFAQRDLLAAVEHAVDQIKKQIA